MDLLDLLGISQAELARRARVSANTANGWIHGKTKASFAPWEFQELADELQVEPSKLAAAFRNSYIAGQAKLKSAHG